MSILPIFTYNHPVLRQKATDITEIDETIVNLAGSMHETLLNALGIGLAANQVGHNEALIIIDLSLMEDEYSEFEHLVMLNPVIDSYSDDEEPYEEGCLSLPGYRDVVLRPTGIQASYTDLSGKHTTIEAGGLLARVIQHEVDHLNGIYFFERLTAIRRTLSRGKLLRISRGSVDTDYPIIKD